MGLRQCRMIGPKEGCSDDREKKNGCEKTRLKIKKKWNSYLKENKGKEVEKNHR